MTNVLKRWPALLLSSGLLLVLSATTARAQQISVKPVSAELAVQDSTLHATFKVEVVNSESSPLTNFFVFFEDSTYISIGDVSAGGTVTSDTTSRLVDLSDKPASRAVVIPVTLKYSLDGEDKEQSWPLTVQLPEAE